MTATSSPLRGETAAAAGRRAPPNSSEKMSCSKPPPRPKSAAARSRSRPAPRRPPGAETFELRRARLALGVDLAAVERRALLLVAKDFVGTAHFGEFVLRLGVLTLVRMILLRQLAKSRLDFCGACRLRHAEHLIRIAHVKPNRKRPALARPFNSAVNLGAGARDARREFKEPGAERAAAPSFSALGSRRPGGRRCDRARRTVIDEARHRHRNRAAARPNMRPKRQQRPEAADCRRGRRSSCFPDKKAIIEAS